MKKKPSVARMYVPSPSELAREYVERLPHGYVPRDMESHLLTQHVPLKCVPNTPDVGAWKPQEIESARLKTIARNKAKSRPLHRDSLIFPVLETLRLDPRWWSTAELTEKTGWAKNWLAVNLAPHRYCGRIEVGGTPTARMYRWVSE